MTRQLSVTVEYMYEEDNEVRFEGFNSVVQAVQFAELVNASGGVAKVGTPEFYSTKE